MLFQGNAINSDVDLIGEPQYHHNNLSTTMDNLRLRGGPKKIKNILVILQGAGYTHYHLHKATGPEVCLTPPTNYVGTTLFLSYITAALALTAFILIKDIVLRWRSRKNNWTPNARLWLGLAAMSFTVLSFNMISFLYQSLTHYLDTTRQSVSVHQLGPWML